MIPNTKEAIEYLKTERHLQRVIGFDETMSFMIKSEDRKKIRKIINKNQDLYYNESHFIRCAVLQLIRRYE